MWKWADNRYLNIFPLRIDTGGPDQECPDKKACSDNVEDFDFQGKQHDAATFVSHLMCSSLVAFVWGCTIASTTLCHNFVTPNCQIAIETLMPHVLFRYYLKMQEIATATPMSHALCRDC